MANAALFIGWNRPVAGREQVAQGLFAEAVEYFSRQQAAGQIESFEPVILIPHGGDLNGFMLVRGDGEKLAAMRWSEEFLDLITQVNVNVERLGLIDAMIGESVQAYMQRVQQALPT